VSLTPRATFLRERFPVPIEQEVEWAAEPIWTLWRREISSLREIEPRLLSLLLFLFLFNQPFLLTLRLLMSYIYGAPSKARNANVVYIWTYVWQR